MYTGVAPLVREIQQAIKTPSSFDCIEISMARLDPCLLCRLVLKATVCFLALWIPEARGEFSDFRALWVSRYEYSTSSPASVQQIMEDAASMGVTRRYVPGPGPIRRLLRQQLRTEKVSDSVEHGIRYKPRSTPPRTTVLSCTRGLTRCRSGGALPNPSILLTRSSIPILAFVARILTAHLRAH